MTYKYDAIVIGAGPAGAACGMELQKSGVKNCVIDKAVFPRGKTCAGLVTGKTYKLLEYLFGEPPEELFCFTSSQIRLFSKQRELVAAPIKRPVKLVNRYDYDNALVTRYKELGGELREGERGYKIDYKANSITLSNGDILSYDTIIFADGALSQAHKLVNVPRSKLAFGVEAYIPSTVLNTKSVDLYFDYLDNGYVWVFPHGDTVCVGAANQYNKKEDYQKILDDVLRDLGVTGHEYKTVGAFLPYGYVVPQQKLPQNVLLIGDAGGFADPISGEGLYMSMQTGIMAAQAVLTDSPKKTYLKSVEPLQQIIRDGKRAQKMFYQPAIHKKLFGRVEGNKRFVSFYFENQVDEYRYTYRQIKQLYNDYKSNK